MTIRCSLKDAQELAKVNSGICLSKKYTNNHTKMRWKCESGHIWETTFANIRRGCWCPKCRGGVRLSIYDCHSVAKAKGGQCLESDYQNADTPMLWICDLGHTWRAKFMKVNNGSWCPNCSHTKKKSILDAQKVATSKNGKCLSGEYKNCKEHLLWECEKGHKWNASLDNIGRGKWCPECSIGKTQRLLQNILESILDVKSLSNYKGFGWLKTSKYGKLELDIYFPDIKLAVEYDGEQHFVPVNFGGISSKEAKKNLKKTKKLDKLKNIRIAQHPEDVKYFIRFGYKNNITSDCVLEKLKKVGIV